MRLLNFSPALGANENVIVFARLDQLVAVETVRTIRTSGGIDKITGVEVNPPVNSGGDKSEVRLLLPAFPARFKAALCGVLAALALCFPVGAAQTPPLRKVGEDVTAYQHPERNADAKSDKKTGDGRLKKLSEKGSEIHNSYSYLFSFVAEFIVGLIVGLIVGAIAGVGIIYTLSRIFAIYIAISEKARVKK